MKLMLLAFAFSVATAVTFASGAPSLSELDHLKAENHVLKVQVLQLQEQLTAAQVKLQTLALSQEQMQLETQFKTALTPADGAVWNWNTLSFDQLKPTETLH